MDGLPRAAEEVPPPTAGQRRHGGRQPGRHPAGRRRAAGVACQGHPRTHRRADPRAGLSHPGVSGVHQVRSRQGLRGLLRRHERTRARAAARHLARRRARCRQAVGAHRTGSGAHLPAPVRPAAAQDGHPAQARHPQRDLRVSGPVPRRQRTADGVPQPAGQGESLPGGPGVPGRVLQQRHPGGAAAGAHRRQPAQRLRPCPARAGRDGARSQEELLHQGLHPGCAAESTAQRADEPAAASPHPVGQGRERGGRQPAAGRCAGLLHHQLQRQRPAAVAGRGGRRAPGHGDAPQRRRGDAGSAGGAGRGLGALRPARHPAARTQLVRRSGSLCRCPPARGAGADDQPRHGKRLPGAGGARHGGPPGPVRPALGQGAPRGRVCRAAQRLLPDAQGLPAAGAAAVPRARSRSDGVCRQLVSRAGGGDPRRGRARETGRGRQAVSAEHAACRRRSAAHRALEGAGRAGGAGPQPPAHPAQPGGALRPDPQQGPAAAQARQAAPPGARPRYQLPHLRGQHPGALHAQGLGRIRLARDPHGGPYRQPRRLGAGHPGRGRSGAGRG